MKITRSRRGSFREFRSFKPAVGDGIEKTDRGGEILKKWPELLWAVIQRSVITKLETWLGARRFEARREELAKE